MSEAQRAIDACNRIVEALERELSQARDLSERVKDGCDAGSIATQLRYLCAGLVETAIELSATVAESTAPSERR